MRERGQGTIYARGSWLWVCYYHDGGHVREAAKDKDGRNTSDYATAKKFLQRKIDGITTEKNGGPAFATPAMRRIKCGDLLDGLEGKFKANGQDSRQNLSLLEKTREHFGTWPALAATSKQFADWKQAQLDAGIPLATAQRPLQMIRAGFRLAVKRGELPRAPFIEIGKEDNARQGFFSEPQIAALLAALPDDGLRDFVAWAAETGQRKSEIAAMTWNMRHGDEIFIPAGFCKNRRARVLPLGPELLAIIESRGKARRVISLDGTAQLAEPIFHRAGAPVGDFKKSWRTATRAAGCSGKLFHDLRRTVARRLLAASVPQALAQDMMGMASPAIFKRYAIADAALQLAAQRKVAEFRKAASL